MNKRVGYVVTTGIIPAHSELELKFLMRFTVDGMTFDLQTGRVSILHIPRFHKKHAFAGPASALRLTLFHRARSTFGRSRL